MKRTDTFGQSIRCPVELRDVSGVRAGFARVIQPEGVRVELSLDGRERLCVGGLVEVVADSPPIGPLRATARVASLESEEDSQGHAIVSTALTFESLSDVQRQGLTRRLRLVRPLVLTFGLDHNDLHEAVADECFVVDAASEDEIARIVAKEDVAVLVLGPSLPAADAHRILSRCHSQGASAGTANIVIGVGTEANLFQRCVDEDRLFYLSRGPLSEEALRSLVVAAAARGRAPAEHRSALGGAAAAPDELMDFCARIASQTEIADVGDLLVQAAQTMVRADRAEYLIYDAAANLLWCPKGATSEGRSESAASGLLGYVARTGERIDLECPGRDARLDPEADNLTTVDHLRLFAEPIVGTMGSVVGVVTVVRNAALPPWTAADVQVMERLAEYAGSALNVILLKHQAQTALVKRHHAVNDLEMYRQEALDENFRSVEQPGNLLTLSPRWLTRAHWLAVSLFVAVLLFMTFVSVSEYATGPGVIRARSKIPAIAARAGLVRSVEVAVGDRVRTGDLLVRFNDTPGTTTGDRVAEQVWAAGNGVIGDIRVRPGQQVNQGELVASIVDEDAGYEVLGFMPGNYAPQLHTGMQLVLRLYGYQGSSEVMRIDRVGSEVIGVQDALRYAGREGAPPLSIATPVVVIGAQLPSSRFSQDGRSYRYYDGMSGDIDVAVRSDRIITTVLRGLKDAFGR